MACKISGCIKIPLIPSAAIARNQIKVIGPKTVPIRPVPNRCTEKSTTKIAIVIGTMYGSKRVVAQCGQQLRSLVVIPEHLREEALVAVPVLTGSA